MKHIAPENLLNAGSRFHDVADVALISDAGL